MKNYTDIKTFADACKALRLDPKKVLPKFTGYPKKDQKAMEAHAKLVIIARALNTLANNGKAWTIWAALPGFGVTAAILGLRVRMSALALLSSLVRWRSMPAISSSSCTRIIL